MNQVKLIDANNFQKNLLEQSITNEDRRFCEKVKFALDKQKEIEIPRSIGTWNIVGTEVEPFGIKYIIKKCSRCGFEHSMIIPGNFCPKCGEIKVNMPLTD